MRKKFTGIVVLALILAVGSVSWAQQGKCPMAKDGKCPMAQKGHHMGMGGGMMMLKQLDLTEQQQEKVKAVMDQYQNEMQGLDEKIDAARKSVHAAVCADTFNEQAIRAAQKPLAAEMENMAVLRGKIFSEIRPILTPEQSVQVKEMPVCKAKKMKDRPKCPAMIEE